MLSCSRTKRPMHWRSLTFLAVCLTLCSVPAFTASNYETAGQVMPGCRSAVQSPDPRPTYGEGFCVGMVAGIVASRSDICLPNPDVKYEEMVQIVVDFIDDQSDRRNQLFTALATQALKQKWPCPAHS